MRPRPAFTLIEILVALIIMSGLIAIMIPVIMGQATRGEPTRVAADLNAVSSALAMFRAHTLTLPDDLEDLANPLTPADRQIDGEGQEPGFPGCIGCSWDRGKLRYHEATGITYYLAAPYRQGL